mgnify:CR=1 FL=1
MLIGSDNVSSGDHSLYFSSDTTNIGGPQDLVLPFNGNYSLGQFFLSMDMFVTEDKGAYFNIQTNQTAAIGWALICEFNTDNSLVITNSSGSILLTTSYLTEEWFEITIDVDLTESYWEVSINDLFQGSFYHDESVGGLDLYASAGNEFWIDDVCYLYQNQIDEVLGCTDELAINYNSEANTDDGSCLYCETPIYVNVVADSTNTGNAAWYIENENGVIDYSGLVNTFYCFDSGCFAITMYSDSIGAFVNTNFVITDQYENQILAHTFGSESSETVNFTVGESDCSFGCTSIFAINYSSDAIVNDGSCEFEGSCGDGEITDCNGVCVPMGWYGDGWCDDGAYEFGGNWIDLTCFEDDGGDCNSIISGCTDSTALNYNPEATDDDGSCEFDDCVLPDYWGSINTGTNQTIMIPAGVTLNNETISNGSAIGVFFINELEEYQCAGYSLINGETTSIAVMGDDSTTEEIDGLVDGAELIWGLWDSSLCEDMLITSTYSSGSNIFGDAIDGSNIFTANGISFVESFTLTTCQVINFPEGWFMYSTYIESDIVDVAELFSPVLESLIIVKDNAGEVYLPEWNYNGIGDVSVDQAYQVKTFNEVSLDICGTQVSPENYPISLESGWNLVPYLREAPADVVNVVSSLLENDNLVIVKSYSGEVFLPEWNYNGIGDMYPEQGYQMKINESTELQYLSNSESYRLATDSKVNIVEPSFYTKPSITDNNMTLVIEDAAWDVLPLENSEIAIFDKNSLLLGVGTYTSPVTVLTIWGDDATTDYKDGFKASEDLFFQIESNGRKTDFIISDWKQGNSEYEINAINVAASIDTKINTEVGVALFDAVPNPTNSVTSISFYTPEQAIVNITIYNVLGELVEVFVDEEFNVGLHYLELNSSLLESGMYYFTMRSNNFEKTKQLIVYQQ